MVITAETWAAARARVLLRDADSAEYAARRYREQAPRFPDSADSMRRTADGLDGHAARCRTAAGDPNLPFPTCAEEKTVTATYTWEIQRKRPVAVVIHEEGANHA